MTENDVVFRIIPEDELANPNSFCYYGWEGTGAYAFWRYATAYYDSAEILFEKFVASAGHNDILDGTGMTMCFLYRHFLELSIKHLYVKFAHPTKDEYKKFLENGHRLISLWSVTKPILSKLRKRAGSTVSLGVLEHYIEEFDKFDPDAMSMRYPVKNDLNPMHESTRLDIINLHERVNELYWAIVGIANDLEGQMEDNVDLDKINAFLAKYEEVRPRVLALIGELRPFEASEPKGPVWMKPSEIDIERGMAMREVYKHYTDDELMMCDTLFYTGRAILDRQLKMPKSPYEAKTDAVKQCVINMECDSMEFGKPAGGSINFNSKMASTVISHIEKTMEVLDWDRG